ncbi:Ribonuclease Y [Geodia barretti]|uniref:Ribonuclease Y n=1 Tax=Geodia barretti TaxID=519541 RepID=A0AA35X024_GEOBA|nr:Ribonuclease Y [Geodia barretti]
MVYLDMQNSHAYDETIPKPPDGVGKPRKVSRMESVIALLAALIGLSVGAGAGFYGRRLVSARRINSAQVEADKIVEAARRGAQTLVIEAKEETLHLRAEWEKEQRDHRSEFKRSERRLRKRDENLDKRANNLERREQTIAQQEGHAQKIVDEIEDSKQQALAKLEEISELSLPQAKDLLMREAEEEIQHEIARRYRDIEVQAQEDAREVSSRILATSIQRMAADVVSEMTVTTVPLPNDDMKGVDLIIDDTPEAVTLSCFDPVRREVARIAVTKLIADGRIHPARIEEMVSRSEKEVEKSIWSAGEEAIFDTGVRGMNPEIIKLLGRLKFRYSYGENVLQHSLEVSHIAGMIASEVGANIKVAKAGGLLHDIGKALTHEVEGPHAEIGAEIANKYNVAARVCACIAEHHDDVMTSPEAFIVAAADAISAARPGARKDTVENYIKRLQALEDVASDFEGVERCFAIQAGREVRVMVRPDSIDDIMASKLARDIVKKVEDNLVYPGQIKVTVIRESRIVEYAR